MNDPDYTMGYDWAAPAETTTGQKHLVAASDIMYDDENTEEFLAKRNQTKLERGKNGEETYNRNCNSYKNLSDN